MIRDYINVLYDGNTMLAISEELHDRKGNIALDPKHVADVITGSI